MVGILVSVACLVSAPLMLAYLALQSPLVPAENDCPKAGPGAGENA